MIAITPPATTDAYAFAVVERLHDRRRRDDASAGSSAGRSRPAPAPRGLTGAVQVIDALDFVAGGHAREAPTYGRR